MSMSVVAFLNANSSKTISTVALAGVSSFVSILTPACANIRRAGYWGSFVRPANLSLIAGSS